MMVQRLLHLHCLHCFPATLLLAHYPCSSNKLSISEGFSKQIRLPPGIKEEVKLYL